MHDEVVVEISADWFLEPLGLQPVAPMIVDPLKRNVVFQAVVDHLAKTGAIAPVPNFQVGAGGLPMRVGGSRYTVRLSKPTKDELTWFGAALLAMMQLDFSGEELLLGAPLTLLVDRFKTLRLQFGEVSVVNALVEGAPTARSVANKLYGNPCREPEAGCRFVSDGHGSPICGITLEQVRKTLEFLVTDRQVLRRLNAVEPIEYVVTI